MNYRLFLMASFMMCTFVACHSSSKYQKGFAVESTSEEDSKEEITGLHKDSVAFETRPGSVLMTGFAHIRLTPVYKVNYRKDNKSSFVGSNSFMRPDETENTEGNIWNNHIMPGFEIVYGFNMLNVSYSEFRNNKQKNFFEKPVLIRALYYPSNTSDTLNFKPIKRNFYIVSVYNEDTNKDKFINQNDLRRLMLFNLNGEFQKFLIPENYSVTKSEYDSENDLMFVFAKFDENGNGIREDKEPVHVFWIDLEDPSKTGRQF